MATTADTDTRAGGLVGRLIAACARAPLPTLLLAAAIGAWGWHSMRGSALDAIPDLSDVQVIVFTEWPGRGPNLVEDQITYPVSSALLSAPKVKFVRGQSFFGLSFVYVIFEDGTDIYWARSRVLEYMNTVTGELPEGVRPTLGPDATGVGWVFQYALVDRSGRSDLQQLRSLQDWTVRYALASVPGVAEVASVGGFVKQYQVQVDPARLRGYDVTLGDVIAAVRNANDEAGGRSIEISGHEHVIRGRGYVHNVDDLAAAVVGTGAAGTPVYVRDVARVQIGPDMRRGIVELNGEGETVGGVVVMRYGENALRVIAAVKERIAEIRKTFPPGVELVVTYDRSQLIEESIATLRHTLIEEMLIVSLVIIVFLWHVRSALVPIFSLPLAVIVSFIPMYYQGLTANIMSLGGIAVAIGAMVDASIILIENVHKKLETWPESRNSSSRLDVVISAMQEVGPSVFFSLLVITVGFLPVFALEGAEGRLFKPLAYMKTYSMAFAAIAAVTVAPALAALLVRGRIRNEDEHPISRWLVGAYAPVVRWVVRRRALTIATAAALIVATIPAYLRLGSEFMPPLNEGVILYMPTAPPGMSMTEASTVLQTMDRKLKEFPEVETVFGKIGRARTATDPAPLGMVEATITLKPRDQWRPGMDWDTLIAEMDAALHWPGMPNIWWMPVQTRTEMLATGMRSPLGIKVYGDDLETIERAAIQIEQTLANVPGTRSAFAERSTGGFFVDFAVRRDEAARQGVSVKDINDVITSAIGGANVAMTVEGRERYPISVRYAREFRDTPELLGQVLIATPSGAQIPLSQVADIRNVTGPPMIRSEDGKLVGFVFVDVTGRPIAGYVEDAKRTVDETVALPAGIRLEWAGQYQYLERAVQKLVLVVPATLALVFFLLYLNTKSLTETVIVLMAVPFSLVGAIWLLYLLGYNMSVAVWIGLIALAGLDAETGVVMLLYLTIAHRARERAGKLSTEEDLTDAIVEGAARRIRPKLMTVATTIIALLAVLASHGTGADLMKRIAAPMVGGLVTSFLLELTVYPAIFAAWKSRALRRQAEPEGGVAV